MHITEVQITKVKRRIHPENIDLEWRHRLDVTLPDGMVLSMDSNITSTFLAYPVNLEVTQEMIKDEVVVTYSSLDDDGNVEYQQTMKVYSTTNLVKSTKTLSVSVLFVDTSKLVFVKGW